MCVHFKAKSGCGTRDVCATPEALAKQITPVTAMLFINKHANARAHAHLW